MEFTQTNRNNHLLFYFDADSMYWSASHSHTVRLWSEALDDLNSEYQQQTIFISADTIDLDKKITNLISQGSVVVVVNQDGKQAVIQAPKQQQQIKQLPEVKVKESIDNHQDSSQVEL